MRLSHNHNSSSRRRTGPSPGAAPGFGILRLPERSPVPGLITRMAVAVGLILLVALLLWVTRGGLRDNAHPDRPMGFVDVFYFTVVTLTTVGYGDIAPVTPGARLVNAVLLTPIRVFLFALFLGTAYELTFLRYRERLLMNQLRERLNNHAIVCGFGVKGRAIVEELLAHGYSVDNIVVIEPDEAGSQEAAGKNLVALKGDASSEALLRAAAVEKASEVLVAPNRDDVCVLICLTVRELAPKVRLIAAAREEENVKLLYRAGADMVVTPSVSGARLMAACVRRKAVPLFLEDLLAFGQGLDAQERVVTRAEAGKTVADLPDLAHTLVVGLSRVGSEHIPFHQLPGLPLQAGDVLVYLTDSVGTKKATGNRG
ncbi:MAG: potassium channel family protein [Armatimonadota bacterium]